MFTYWRFHKLLVMEQAENFQAQTSSSSEISNSNQAKLFGSNFFQTQTWNYQTQAISSFFESLISAKKLGRKILDSFLRKLFLSKIGLKKRNKKVLGIFVFLTIFWLDFLKKSWWKFLASVKIFKPQAFSFKLKLFQTFRKFLSNKLKQFENFVKLK